VKKTGEIKNKKKRFNKKVRVSMSIKELQIKKAI